MFRLRTGQIRYSRGRRLAAVAFLSLLLSSFADYLLAYWVRLPRSTPWQATGIYRRIGPESGPQVFCAGSSLLIAAFSWPAISESLGQGIENWSVGGSSPDLWEQWQQHEQRSNATIIGVSVYDLNEMHVAEDRANIVPLSRTITDLWASDTDPALSHRLLTQYALKYVRLLFPTAGYADKVQVGLRYRIARALGLERSLGDHEGVLHERAGVLDIEEDTMRVSDWSSARLLRRIEALKDENHGRHEFARGPKHLAFQRMLLRARRQGRVIIVVLPVSSTYTNEFIDEGAAVAFEKAIQDAAAIAPGANLVRLDRVPAISDPRYFFDLVHLNSFGRSLATKSFLTELSKGESLAAASAVSITPHN